MSVKFMTREIPIDRFQKSLSSWFSRFCLHYDLFCSYKFCKNASIYLLYNMKVDTILRDCPLNLQELDLSP